MSERKFSSTFFLLVFAVVVCIFLSACTDARESTQNELVKNGKGNMRASNETLNANTKIIKEHLDNIQLSEQLDSRAYVAKRISSALGFSSDKEIVTVDSNSAATPLLTLTDEDGVVYMVQLSKTGSFDTIEDSEGNIIFKAIY